MRNGDRRLTLEHLRAFLAIVECGGFADAAARLSRTQSALTHQIRAAEDILQTRLLVRTRGHFSGLTDEGARLLPHARHILGSVETAVESIAPYRLEGHVRIGMTDDFDIQSLIPLIAQFEFRHGGCEVSTRSDISAQLEKRFSAGELDIIVSKRCVTAHAGPAPEALRFDRLSWVSGANADWRGKRFLPLVAFQDGCVYRKQMLDSLEKRGIPWRIAYESNSYASVRAAVSANIGMSLLPETQIAEDHDRITAISGHELPDAGFVEIIIKVTSRRTSAILAFKTAMENRFRNR